MCRRALYCQRNLFLTFINDLLTLPFARKVSTFADDVAIQYRSKSWEDNWENINHDLKLLRTWCVDNSMLVNAAKTKIINFDFKGFNFDRVITFHKNENCEYY